MISRVTPRGETPAPPSGSWRRLLAGGASSAGELLDLVGLPRPAGEPASGAAEAARQFPVRVPRGFVARMRKGDPADPLLRQVLATAEETRPAPGFTADPLGERRAAPRPGLLHKYRGRVLLIVTGACPVHCRYCFRRHFPYPEHRSGPEPWAGAVAHVAADPAVEEVILSGGDPLMVDDRRLATLARQIADLPHVRRLRVHSRMPVILPERVDGDLLSWLAGTRLSPVMVVHANHPAEIDGAVAAALGRLRAAGVTVLNQSVLLAGINDDTGALAELSGRLFEAGALPYYLHLLDRVAGAAHFEVPEERARGLARELAARLPGYLVPRLVREVPGAAGKVPLDLRLGALADPVPAVP